MINHDFPNKIFFSICPSHILDGGRIAAATNQNVALKANFVKLFKAQWLVNFSMQMASQRAKL